MVVDNIYWELFLETFRDIYLSNQWRQGREEEFHQLKQKNMTIEEYERKFDGLKPFASYRDNGIMLVQHFIRGLND